MDSFTFRHLWYRRKAASIPGLIGSHRRRVVVRIMAIDDRITLIIEGLPEDDGQVRLAAFMSQLQSLSATISRLDREMNNGRVTTYFRIVELSYKSPINVVIEPQPLRPGPAFTGHLVIESLVRIAQTLEAEDNLTDIDADVLEDIRALARPVGRTVKNATLIFNDHHLELTETLGIKIDKALAVEEESEGALDGMLDQINVHLGANTFHIYPVIGPRKVTCHFPARLFDDAVSAVGRRVEVTGTLRYRAGANFPHQVAVAEIEVFPPDHELPTWDDLRGRAPDATGMLTSEAFVRELRDAWR